MNAIRSGEFIHAAAQRSSIVIPLEWAAYGALLLIALVFRIAEIDVIPLSESEAAQALSAWHHIFPNAPGVASPAQSVITFWSQVISFSVLGASEFTARLSGTLAGLILICMPLAFRRWLGSGEAFLAALILTFSSVSIATARENHPAVWATIFALAAIASWWRAWETRKTTWIYWGIGWYAALIFLTGGSGFLLGMILAIGTGIALIGLILRAPQALERPGDEVLLELQTWLRTIPWRNAGAVTLLVLFAAATGFMAYPAGLSIIGQAIQAGLGGFLHTQQPGTESALGLRTFLVYEPLLLLFGALAVIVLIRLASLTPREYFLVSWIVAAAVLLAVYADGQAAHALFLTVPLIFLALPLLRLLLSNIETALYWNGHLVDSDATGDPFSQRYWWIKWVIGIAVFFLLMMLSVHLQAIGRGLLVMPGGISLSDLIARTLDTAMILFRYSLLWGIITIMIALVMFLMVSGAIGPTNTLQGYGLGLLAFMLLTGLGVGWNISVVRATNAAEFWHRSASTEEVLLLRTTLQEVSDRVTRGERQLSISIVEDAKIAGMANVLAWITRDYPNARFVPSTTAAQRDAVVITNSDQAEPDLGAAYVGQSFALRSHWSQSLDPVSFLGWYLQRSTRPNMTQEDRVILWLRMDVYDGVSQIGDAR